MKKRIRKTGEIVDVITYNNFYRSERERIQSSCPQLNFCIPDDEYSRLNECNKFISEGKNIATTHALFSLFNTETIDKLNLRRPQNKGAGIRTLQPAGYCSRRASTWLFVSSLIGSCLLSGSLFHPGCFLTVAPLWPRQSAGHW